MAKKIKSNKIAKKAKKKSYVKKQPDNKPVEQPVPMAAAAKSGFDMRKAAAVIVAVIILILAYRGIDYYTGWGNPEKVIKRSLDEAEKNAVYKRYTEAIKKYEYVIDKWGNDPKYTEDIKQAKLNLAKAYKDSEQYLKAIELYKALTAEYRESNRDMYAWLLLELAESYSAILDTEQALVTYNQIVKEFKDTDWSAEALFGIAEAYRARKDYKNAVIYYDIIVEKYQKGFLSAEALTNKAKIFEELGKIKEAVKIYDRVVKEFPDIVTEYAKSRLDILSGQAVK